MGVIIESGVFEVLSVVLIIVWSFYSYVSKNYDYWQKRGVPYVEAVFPLGTLVNFALGRQFIGEEFDKCYKQQKGERYFGILEGRRPILVVKDPELIKLILTKDFRYFTDRIQISSKKEYIVNHLFNMTGQDWRNMRLTLAPTFTSGRMKAMFPLIEKCSDQLKEYMDSLIKKESIVDVKDTLMKLTMDIISSCAFGLEINSLTDKNCEFYKVGTWMSKPSTFRMVRRLWYGVVPILSKLYSPPLVSQDITDFFTKIIKETVSYREKNGVVRNDFLDLLIKIRHNKLEPENEDKSNGHPILENDQNTIKGGFTIEVITAQSFVFFLAGFETSSSTASFCLYELASNQEIQEKVFQEVIEVLSKYGGNVTYQALQEMKYMDQVINETLRLYPSLSVLNRTCTETYNVPDSNLVIEKGTRIAIPVFSIHRDSEYYSDPGKFDPERFTEEKIKKRHPYLHLPFGEGPRMCIGMRFGLMQTKAALTTMLYNYHFDVTPETEIPIKIHKRAFLTIPEKPVNLKIKKRDIKI